MNKLEVVGHYDLGIYKNIKKVNYDHENHLIFVKDKTIMIGRFKIQEIDRYDDPTVYKYYYNGIVIANGLINEFAKLVVGVSRTLNDLHFVVFVIDGVYYKFVDYVKVDEIVVDVISDDIKLTIDDYFIKSL